MRNVTTALLIMVLAVCGFIGVGVQSMPMPDNDIVVSLHRPTNDIEMLEKAMSSVVKVCIGGGHGTGSYIGFGIVLTAGHCVDDPVDMVVFENGDEYPVLNQCRHPDYDVGFVIIESLSQPTLEFRLEKAKRGEEIFVLGNPHDMEFIATKGIVGGVGCMSTFGPIDLLIVDASPHGGHSGSPVLDSEGRITGIWVGGQISRCGAFLPGLGAAVQTEDILCALAHAELEITQWQQN